MHNFIVMTGHGFRRIRARNWIRAVAAYVLRQRETHIMHEPVWYVHGVRVVTESDAWHVSGADVDGIMGLRFRLSRRFRRDFRN